VLCFQIGPVCNHVVGIVTSSIIVNAVNFFPYMTIFADFTNLS